MTNLAHAVTESMKRHKRKPADFYPTPADCTQALIDRLQLPRSTRIWEPACGDGAMARVFEANGYQVTASDLRHTGYGDGGVDFLRSRDTDFGAIITNPPFAVAAEFIRHARSLAPVVAMLLKSNYWHAKTRLPLFDQGPPTHIFPLTWRPAFLAKERGDNPLMDVMWCVWEGIRLHPEPVWYEPLVRPKGVVPLEPLLTTRLAALGEALDDLTEVLRG